MKGFNPQRLLHHHVTNIAHRQARVPFHTKIIL